MKKNKLIYYVRIAISSIVLILSVFSFTVGLDFFVQYFHIQLFPNISKLAISFSFLVLAVILLILLVTFVFGRFYCSVICPFGILQEFIGIFYKRKNNLVPNLYKTRYVVASAVFGLFIEGWIIGFKLLDPYTNFGLIISTIFLPFKIQNVEFVSLLPGIISLLFILFLVIWKKRIFCTAVCPIGTLMGLFAKYGLFKITISDGKCISCGSCNRQCPVSCIDGKNRTVNNEICVRCMKCMAVCPTNAFEYKTESKEHVKFNQTRRDFIAASVLTAGALAVGAGAGIAELNKIGDGEDITRVICPPGAGSTKDLYLKCSDCQLCVINCKTKIIKPRDANHKTIHLDYSNGYCDYSCTKCNEVCPVGALQKMTLSKKQVCRIGLAKIDRDICIGCGLCVTKCPANALEFDENRKLKYNAAVCIGCGACEYVCPQKPKKAIEIIAIASQSQAQKARKHRNIFVS